VMGSESESNPLILATPSLPPHPSSAPSSDGRVRSSGDAPVAAPHILIAKEFASEPDAPEGSVRA
jgi:hypothetical protein